MRSLVSKLLYGNRHRNLIFASFRSSLSCNISYSAISRSGLESNKLTMTDTMYDVIVVGAGIEGSSTAYQLSRRANVNVLLLEQYPLPHTRGSSHGATRIIRKSYPKQVYSEMVIYAMDEWKRLGKETGETLYENTGYINIGSLEDPKIKAEIESMKRNNCPFETYSPEKFRERFPNLKYDDDVGCLYDLEGGVLFADRCLQTLHRLFVKQGGVLKDAHKVEAIHPGETVRVVTSAQTFTTKSVVMCCGPWTNSALKMLDLKLPLTTLKMSVCYWSEKEPGSHSPSHNMPFSERMSRSVTSPYNVFGMPSNEYPGHFKLLLHWGPEADPETRDYVDVQWVLSLLEVYVRRHYPGLVPKPSIVEPCFYTMTPDKDLILDHHPKYENIVIGAGFSGHGFKLAPAVGDILADLVLGSTPKYDVNMFKISRFSDPDQKATPS